MGWQASGAAQKGEKMTDVIDTATVGYNETSKTWVVVAQPATNLRNIAVGSTAELILIPKPGPIVSAPPIIAALPIWEHYQQSLLSDAYSDMQDIGSQELIPLNGNRGRLIDIYHSNCGYAADDPEPWCSCFTCSKNRNALRFCGLWKDGLFPMDGYTVTCHAWYVAHGGSIAFKDALPADQFWLLDSNGDPFHTGFVHEVNHDEGWIITIEGNHQDPVTNVGKICMIKRYNSSRIAFASVRNILNIHPAKAA